MIDYKILAAGTMALIFTLSLPGGASAAFASGEVGAAAGTDISLSLAQNRRGAGKGGKGKGGQTKEKGGPNLFWD